MSIDYKVVGERLKSARVKKGYTQEVLAELVNLSVTFISRIERGSSHINLTRLNQFCELLNITEGEILNGASVSAKNYLSDDLSNLLKSCPPEKIKLVYNVVKAIVEN